MISALDRLIADCDTLRQHATRRDWALTSNKATDIVDQETEAIEAALARIYARLRENAYGDGFFRLEDFDVLHL